MTTARNLALLAALVAPLAAPPARADQVGPVQVGSASLATNTNGQCETGVETGTVTGGAAVFIADLGRPKPRLVGVLVLQGLTPNRTYRVGLVQTPSGEGCIEGERTVTTNGKGNGILKMQELLDPGTTGAFFTAFSPSSDRYGVIASTPTFAISRLGPPTRVAPSTARFGRR